MKIGKIYIMLTYRSRCINSRSVFEHAIFIFTLNKNLNITSHENFTTPLKPMGVNTVSTNAIYEISLLLKEIIFTSKLNF